jgi:hypothetical protein
MRHSTLALALGLALGAQGTPLVAQNAIPAAELDAIRAATEKYADVAVAEAEGYVEPLHMCVESIHEGQPRQLGAMGLHYIRPDLLGITGEEPRVNGNGTHTDFKQPSVLIYEPMADGSMKLVAIENLVWAEAWREAGNDAAPSFHGNDYYYMHDNPETDVDEAHGFEPHYELHFWLYEENPSGMFMPWNPRVSCDAYKMAASH